MYDPSAHQTAAFKPIQFSNVGLSWSKTCRKYALPHDTRLKGSHPRVVSCRDLRAAMDTFLYTPIALRMQCRYVRLCLSGPCVTIYS
jgi:hypothetical protein